MKPLDVYIFESLMTKAIGTSTYCKNTYENYTEPMQIGGFLTHLRELIKNELELSLDEISMIRFNNQTIEGLEINLANYPDIINDDNPELIINNIISLSEIEKNEESVLSKINWESLQSIIANYTYRTNFNDSFATTKLSEQIINNIKYDSLKYNEFEKKIIIEDYDKNQKISVCENLPEDFLFICGNSTNDKERQQIIFLIGVGLYEVEKMIKYYKDNREMFVPEMIICALHSKKNDYVFFIKKDISIRTIITLAKENKKSKTKQKDAVFNYFLKI